MATANKQKSGNWQVRAYVGKGKDGKPVYKKITAPTKREALRLADEYITEWRENSNDLTVGQCIENYINLKKSVLSPYTVTGYTKLHKNAYALIKDISIYRIDQISVQTWISAYASDHSAKTVKNAFSLLQASLKVWRPDLTLNVTLPQIRHKKLYLPTLEDIEKVLEISQPKMRIAIMLAAFCSLRRGEICALEYEDIDYKTNTITINKATVKNPDHTYSIQQPKTQSSNRRVKAPQFLIDEIGHGSGRIIDIVPHSISVIFDRTVAEAGTPDFRFHDLRHFYASELHSQGIPDAYIEAMGGWVPGSSVMKRIYRNTFTDEQERNNKKVVDFWERSMERKKAQ